MNATTQKLYKIAVQNHLLQEQFFKHNPSHSLRLMLLSYQEEDVSGNFIPVYFSKPTLSLHSSGVLRIHPPDQSEKFQSAGDLGMNPSKHAHIGDLFISQRVSHGWSKLCHRKFSGLLSFSSLTTRFPDSKSSATGFSAVPDEFDDQTISIRNLLWYQSKLQLTLLFDPMSTTTDSPSSAAFHLPAQLLPLFRSYGLMGIVDGSETSPPKFTSTEHKNQGIINPGYMVWQYKDQTVLGWIISSLSPAVVSTIYGLETSRLAWQALGARFAAPSTSCISLIKRKLQSLQQGSMQCQEFLDAVKALANELSAVGKPIEDSDLILSVLNGLNSSFHSFVTTYMLMAKEKSMSFSDFHAELLNFDLMQKFHSHNIQQETGSYAFYSHKSAPKTGYRQNKPRRDGHQALDCFNRMNYSYQGRHPPTELAAMIQLVEQNSNAPYTDLPSSAPLPQPIDGIDNPITLSLSNSSLDTNSITSLDPASSLSSAVEIPLPQPSSRMITRSQTGHSAPRMFPDYHLHYTTRHPLKALHAGSKLSKFDGEPLSDPSEYRQTVGALQYVTLTRPDIAYSLRKTKNSLVIGKEENVEIILNRIDF
ncbi:hypothetical protein SADUNF_Sadunf11G0092000 [Salix dunnii]|uniref:Uncharacterized protein n=1 Tax=Salix dunnii TaxID=1413687 RepID=A0A835JTV5_9ROSI|nr:hypothetical protein SADUNF_Sadunf11G0092000 [Salix dunnii]